MIQSSITTERWNRLISNPLIVDDKMKAPLVIWGKPTDMVQLDTEGYMRCIADNLLYISALQVDIDNGCRIEEFVHDYHRYSYQLYTSYSYGYKEGDRFRAIFPLKEYMYMKHICPPTKQILMDMFPMVDVTCFDKCHWQIVPCIRSRQSPYRYMQHDGEKLSFALENFAKIASEYNEDRHWKKEIAEADKDPNAKHDGALKYVQKIFDATTEGSRNRTVYAKLMWLRDTVGVTYSEVLTLKPPMGFDSEYSKMVERLYV